MSVFRDRADAAEFIGGFFREEAVSGGKFFAGTGVITAYVLSDPDLRIVLDASVTPEPGRAFAVYVDDPTAPAAHVDLIMSADTFDALYGGEAQAVGLLMSGKVKSQGDLTAAMRLLPALGTVIPHYKAYAEKHGR
jgi:hypothetical protein